MAEGNYSSEYMTINDGVTNSTISSTNATVVGNADSITADNVTVMGKESLNSLKVIKTFILPTSEPENAEVGTMWVGL